MTPALLAQYAARSRNRIQPRHRGDTDDGPGPLLDHVGKSELAREKDGGEVHRHQSIPVFDGRVDDVGLDPNARIVDEDVNPAGFPHDPFHQLPDLIGIGDVADGFDDLARRFVEREVHAVDPVSEVQELPGESTRRCRVPRR